jgi:hypothetical protein
MSAEESFGAARCEHYGVLRSYRQRCQGAFLRMLKLPAISGVIARRILVNYRVDPGVLARALPPPFRPQLVSGYGIAGICLIRLTAIRPRGFPALIGLSSENAAHRSAVEWDERDGVRTGVYIRRRDTNSRLNVLVGGRLFPGVHHHASFVVKEMEDELAVSMESDDGATAIKVRARRGGQWPETSVFESVDEASQFFAAGSLGYSRSVKNDRYQGLELRCRRWEVTPLHAEEVRSSLFDDRSLFPAGSIELDCALLMEGIEHEWHALSDVCCET